MAEIYMERVRAEETNVLHGKKAELRKAILRSRNDLSPQQRQMWDSRILERLVEYDRTYPCPVYLCYVSYKSEAATKEFILWCLGEGKTVFVPKVLGPAEMEFYRITAWEELKTGYQGILEPEALPERAFSRWLTENWPERALPRQFTEDLPERVFPRRITEDLPERTLPQRLTESEPENPKKPEKLRLRMFLPGAVFDRNGNRIGYGGGFYDRWLAKWNSLDEGNPAELEKIGLAYGMQIVNAIPAEDYDRKVDRVITEKCTVHHNAVVAEEGLPQF